MSKAGRLVIGLLILSLVCVGFPCFGDAAGEGREAFLFRGRETWGMSRSEIVDIEGEGQPWDGSDFSALTYSDIAVGSTTGFLNYLFSSEGLFLIAYTLPYSQRDYDALCAALDAACGERMNGDSVDPGFIVGRINPTYYSDEEMRKMSYCCWEAAENTVVMMLADEIKDNTLSLFYCSEAFMKDPEEDEEPVEKTLIVEAGELSFELPESFGLLSTDDFGEQYMDPTTFVYVSSSVFENSGATVQDMLEADYDDSPVEIRKLEARLTRDLVPYVCMHQFYADSDEEALVAYFPWKDRIYLVAYTDADGLDDASEGDFASILDTVFIPAGASPAPAESYEALQKGDKGEAVRRLQARLVELKYLVGAADGDFGNRTKEAVERFQAAAGLEVTGIADGKTQEALFAADAPAAQ